MLCLTCQFDNPQGPAKCSKCDGHLSRIVPGGAFLKDRFRVNSMYDAGTWGIAWSVTDTDGKSQGLLHEIPFESEDRDKKRQFGQWVNSLKSQPDSILLPVQYPLSDGARFFVMYHQPTGQPLKKYLNSRAGTENLRTWMLNLLQHLDVLHSCAPPLFHRGIDGGSVMILPNSSVQLAYFSFPPRAEGDLESAAGMKDLVSLGRLACLIQHGKPFAGNMDDAKRKELMAWKDFALAFLADRALDERGRLPASVPVIRKEMESALAIDLSKPATAIPQLKALYDLSGSSLVRLTLEKLEAANKPAESKPTQAVSDPIKPVEPQPVSKPPIPPLVTMPEPAAAVTEPVAVHPIVWESQLNPVTQAEIVPEPAPVPPPPYIYPSPKPPATANRMIFAAGAAVVLLSLIVYYMLGSTERKFDSQIAKGNLVSQSGESALATYREAVKDKGVNSSVVQNLKTKVAPLLQTELQNFFNVWKMESEKQNAPNATLMAEWLSEINPSGEAQAMLAYLQGDKELDSRNLSKAEAQFQRALSLKPNWELPLNGLGKVSVAALMYQRAADYYLRAAQADQSWYYPYFNLGNLYRNFLRDPSAAERSYISAIQRDPGRASFHFELAQLYFFQGKSRFSLACAEYDKALSGNMKRGLQPGDYKVAVDRKQRTCAGR